MKKSIIYLGILVISFSSFTVRSNQFNNKFITNYIALNSEIVNQENLITSVGGINKIKSEKIYYKVKDSTLLDINTIFGSHYEKSIDEIIIENNSIIGTQIEKPEYLVYFAIINNEVIDISIDNVQFVSLNKSIDDIIAEDKEITESDLLK
ncbi:MAG: hypothetical protein ABI549_11235 [Flavobacterium sp.]|uniref:hypothetical protein n=1 Tax=Flavobacterium sp. TaxID=239 RepID=UPI003262DF9A